MNIYNLLRRIYHSLLARKHEKNIRELMKAGLKLGNGVSILDGCSLDPSHCYLISIGDKCTICPNVRLIAHDASTKKVLHNLAYRSVSIRFSFPTFYSMSPANAVNLDLRDICFASRVA